MYISQFIGTISLILLTNNGVNCINSSIETSRRNELASLTKIFDGRNASIEKYPYMVSIQLNLMHMCGGTLLMADWVLTATHCLLNGRFPKYPTLRRPGRYTVVAGLNVVDGVGYTASRRRLLNSVSDEDPNRRKVLSTHTHEEYDPVKVLNDIGLMKLVSKFELGDTIQLVTLPVPSVIIPRVCHVAGWGLHMGNTLYDAEDEGETDSTDDGQQQQQQISKQKVQLRVAEVPILNISFCQEIFAMATDINRELQICADESRNGACSGDSGGALICQGCQMGIVSFGGSAKCEDNFVSLYTRVDKYLDWIAAVTAAATARKMWSMMGIAVAYLLHRQIVDVMST